MGVIRNSARPCVIQFSSWPSSRYLNPDSAGHEEAESGVMKFQVVFAGRDLEIAARRHWVAVRHDSFEDHGRYVVVMDRCLGSTTTIPLVVVNQSLPSVPRQPAGCIPGFDASLVFIPSAVPKAVVFTVGMRPSAKSSMSLRVAMIMPSEVLIQRLPLSSKSTRRDSRRRVRLLDRSE